MLWVIKPAIDRLFPYKVFAQLEGNLHEAVYQDIRIYLYQILDIEGDARF